MIYTNMTLLYWYDMRFDGTESLFFSLRQTTPGAGSAQARVDLRWTGEAAT